jgi:tetratricopeptide (TPR) repeat protein
VRLPAQGEFRGPTHEAFYFRDRDHGATDWLPGVSFRELPKSEEALRQKAERDATVLAEYVASGPADPRWYFYLGDALQRLGRYDEAIDAFYSCTEMRGWNEESAWAMYRAAECYVALDLFEEALEACTLGMARHAALPELPWYAGYICWRLGRYEQCIAWARIAIVHGRFAGRGSELILNGWSHPFGCWEGPYDLLRYALRAVGKEDEATEAERLFHSAVASHQAWLASLGEKS